MAMTKVQMHGIAKDLAEQGFIVSTEESEQEGVWYDDLNDPPMYYSISWGNWTINQDGELYIDAEFFPVNNCDLVEFIKSAHTAIHAYGGEVIRE